MGFHHTHRSKGVAVATDIDDGGPGAYDLPSPTTAGALAPVTPIKDSSGKPLTNGVNGKVEEDNERWVERTGWAPRFGPGTSVESAEGESFADHQTWLEGRLEDKFYGGRSAPLYGTDKRSDIQIGIITLPSSCSRAYPRGSQPCLEEVLVGSS